MSAPWAGVVIAATPSGTAVPAVLVLGGGRTHPARGQPLRRENKCNQGKYEYEVWILLMHLRVAHSPRSGTALPQYR
jgi:hypothetical protein